jgi:protein ImuA
MRASKAHIISELQKEILLLQGFKPASNDAATNAGLGLIRQAFPNSTFPLGAVHEFFCAGAEEASASLGFIAGILSSLMKKDGASIWITSSPTIFPAALKTFGIEPHKIIFIHPKKEKEKLFVIEEALKCDGLSAVVGEINEISFTESRRLQLAVEQTKVTGFLLRRNPKNLSTACVTRWMIKPLPTEEETGLPGIGFPRWDVALLKVRNGKPGSWQMEWREERFRLVQRPVLIATESKRKIV